VGRVKGLLGKVMPEVEDQPQMVLITKAVAVAVLAQLVQ
jgi:hypothetical protein